MTSQKHLFDLPDDTHYLNGAYMSPLMKSVEAAGVTGIKKKLNPATYYTEDFFLPAEEVRRKFGKLINASAEQIAVIPSASYGLKSAINNIPANTGNHAIVVSEEFPSGYYALAGWCKEHGKALKVIDAPGTLSGKGAAWNNKILEAITSDTSAVVISSIHWTDGTTFDLQKIGEKCKASNALLIVDGTQSVGALSIDVAACHIDALICAAYKWLMGPYSIGLAYYGEAYNNGVPIEDSWLNRFNANDFTRLAKYVDSYKPGAARYNMGEFGNPILLAMLDRSLEQVIQWGADNIQAYCGNLVEPLLQYLQENNCWVEDKAWRANHIFGFLLPASIDKAALLAELKHQKIIVSLRGDAIRVSTHLYNNEANITALMTVLKKQQH